MDENQLHCLKARIQAAVLAFSLKHKIPLSCEVIRCEAWTTQKTWDIAVRVDLKDKEEEKEVL